MHERCSPEPVNGIGAPPTSTNHSATKRSLVMKTLLKLALAFPMLAVLTGPAAAQGGWSVAIEQFPGLTNCGNTTNIPVAGATDCTSAQAAAWNLLTTLLQTPNCMSPGCPTGSTIAQGVSSCTPDPYTHPNGSPAIRWQVSWTWNCTASARGLLKVCKVAGPGIAVGTPFTFTAGSNTFTVPAGPAPGGTCAVGPSFPVGSVITVAETIPAGDIVSNITVAPPSQLVGTPNLAYGSVGVTIGSGVTEVTYVNKKTGFLEICKEGEVGGNLTFYVNPGGLGPFVVPAGRCSPAILVPAGPIVISEMPTPGTTMVGCSTIPAGQQGPCNLGAQTSTVTISPGDVSAQTIAFVTNKHTRPR
jgi:hypothetical protein